ncbi:MAG: hypothetical protein LCI00_05465 [Chloroflexi bacterium]|nr:hypothetical protein [Chloroflexota bacterium]
MAQSVLEQYKPEDVVAEVNKVGLTKAARHFHTSRSSLSRWLQGKGYKARPQYSKEAANPNQQM